MSTPVPDRLSVLIVEPDEDTADTLADVLALYGHQARVAGGCKGAGEAVRAFTPDVVIQDVALPDGDGYWLAVALSNLLPRHTVFIALTSRQPVDERCRLAGFRRYLVKPVPPAVVAELLDVYAARRGTPR
ncbi:MAG: response regulator [Gemmataceae bacterium]